MEESFAAFRCLAVTVDNYRSVPALETCNSDGAKFVKMITSTGICSKAKLLPDFTRAQIFEGVDRLLRSRSGNRPLKLVFFAACHGYERDGKLWLKPRDSASDRDDFPLEHLIDHPAPECKLRRGDVLICFLATCRTRRPGRSSVRRFLGGAKPFVFLMFPCAPGDDAPDDGLFTQVLVDTMGQWRGNAVELLPLADAVGARVEARSRGEQQPFVEHTPTSSPVYLVGAAGEVRAETWHPHCSSYMKQARGAVEPLGVLPSSWGAPSRPSSSTTTSVPLPPWHLPDGGSEAADSWGPLVRPGRAPVLEQRRGRRRPRWHPHGLAQGSVLDGGGAHELRAAPPRHGRLYRGGGGPGGASPWHPHRRAPQGSCAPTPCDRHC